MNKQIKVAFYATNYALGEAFGAALRGDKSGMKAASSAHLENCNKMIKGDELMQMDGASGARWVAELNEKIARGFDPRRQPDGSIIEWAGF